MENKTKYKFLVELNICLKPMEEPMSTAREVICDTREQCVEFIKKQIKTNSEANIEQCKKTNNFRTIHSIKHKYESIGYPKYEFGKLIDGNIVDCLVTWTKFEEVNNLKAKIKRIFTKEDTLVEKTWYWWYNIYPIPYVTEDK